ncbi:SAM-dependent methyltransferase [Rhodococcus sp. 06-1059B-a]|nr:class I SAM-dependent methyltransferase [Rhodococcus sp. 06-1059B-a]OZD70547.1 SAM-dependent methyltransferase [Rhodococcus sp. 06-1059B-a]
MPKEPGVWNHNVHYYDLAVNAATSPACAALDVGTGDGLLSVRLADKFAEVAGIDPDASVIAHARTNTADNITWIVGDVLTYDLPDGHYDLVAAVATVHHFPDLEHGLQRLANLTAAGGALVVIGCARSSSVRDYVYELMGVIQHQYYSRTRGFWQHNAPVQWEFPHTYAEVRAIAAEVLPGMRWKRLPLWRYAIVWHKPS